MSEVKIEITTKTLFKIALFGLALFLGVLLREVLVMLFVAFIINAGFRPLVDALDRRKIPRGISIFLILVGVILLVSLVLVITAGEFISQFQTLIKALPGIFANVVDYLNTNIPVLNTILPLGQIEQEIGQLSTELLNNQIVQNLLTGENILSVASSAFDIFGSAIGLVMSIFTVGMVSVYMLQRKNHVYEGIVSLLPDDLETRGRELLERIQDSLGSWLLGQISLMMIIGVITYLIVWLPSLFIPTYTLDEFALPIALVAGIFEFLPSIGPILTSILAGLIAFGTAGIGALLYIVIAFAVLQNLEAIFIVPMVMRKAVGIDPIITILGILAALKLTGVLGAILVVPIIVVVKIALVESAQREKRRGKKK